MQPFFPQSTFCLIYFFYYLDNLFCTQNLPCYITPSSTCNMPRKYRCETIKTWPLFFTLASQGFTIHNFPPSQWEGIVFVCVCVFFFWLSFPPTHQLGAKGNYFFFSFAFFCPGQWEGNYFFFLFLFSIPVSGREKRDQAFIQDIALNEEITQKQKKTPLAPTLGSVILVIPTLRGFTLYTNTHTHTKKN